MGGGNAFKLICLPVEKGSTLKKRIWSTFFPFKVEPFSECAACKGSNHEVTKVVSLGENGGKSMNVKFINSFGDYLREMSKASF